jgi:hypothetical protein
LFDFSDLLRDYTLHLDRPFERTVALWILRKIACHSNYAISKCVYELHGKQHLQNLVLSSLSDSQVEQELDDQHMLAIKGLLTLKQAAGDSQLSLQLFEKADTGKSF